MFSNKNTDFAILFAIFSFSIFKLHTVFRQNVDFELYLTNKDRKQLSKT